MTTNRVWKRRAADTRVRTPAAVLVAILMAGCVGAASEEGRDGGTPPSGPLDAPKLDMGLFKLVEHNHSAALWAWDGNLEPYVGPPAPPPSVISSPFQVPPVPLRIEATTHGMSAVSETGLVPPPAIRITIRDQNGDARCVLFSTPCILRTQSPGLNTWHFQVQCAPDRQSCDPPSNRFVAELRFQLDSQRGRPADDSVSIFGGAEESMRAPGTVSSFRTGYSGPEPNIGVTSNGSVFASAWSTILRSLDRGESWEPVHEHKFNNADPMLWVDSWTDCIYNAPMFPTNVGATIYESCDDGKTWTTIHSQHVQRGGVYDHQKLITAPPGPEAPPVAGVLHPTAFVLCYGAIPALSEGAPEVPAWPSSNNCAISLDGGRTWPVDGPIWNQASNPECESQIMGHPAAAPDGTIAVGKAYRCSTPLVMVSRDSGLTWTVRKGPGGVGADTIDPEIAFTRDGSMYLLWQGQRGEDRAYLARSDDLGETWFGPWNVTPPGVGSSVFAGLAAGTPGRVAMAFHATNYTTAPTVAPDDARWYTYVVTTENGNTREAAGPTFVSHRVQPIDDPVQVGSICNVAQGCQDGNRNLLDFIDAGVGPDGTFYTVIADGCPEGCGGEVATPQLSRSDELVIIRLDGWNIFG